MAKTKKKTASKPAKKAKAKVAVKPQVKTQAKPKKSSPKPKKAPAKPAVSKPKKTVPVPKKATKPVKKSTSAAEKPAKPETRPAAVNLNLNILPVVNQRPIAHKPAKSVQQDETKTRYTDEELKEFEDLIQKKLATAREEFRILKYTLNRNNDEGTDSTSGGNTKVLEDGAETAEKENLGQQAARQQKYITNLENALVRIKNGTYGICSVTGKLISKERLIAVPHTTQSIEAKMLNKD